MIATFKKIIRHFRLARPVHLKRRFRFYFKLVCYFNFQILKEALKYNGSESNPGNQQVGVNN